MRKKFTLLLASLFLVLGSVWAQVQEGKAYYLKVATLEGAYIDPTTPRDDTQNVVTIGVSNSPTKVYFKKNNAAWLISTNSDCNGNFWNIDRWGVKPGQTEGADWTMVLAEDGIYYLQCSAGYLGHSDIAIGNKLYSNSEVGQAVKVQFVEATQPTTSVTYTFKYGEKTIATQEVGEVIIGAAFPEITAVFPMGVVAAKPAGTVSEENAEQTIEVTIDNSKLPFVAAENYKSIEYWYYMNIRDDGPTYAYYDSSISYIKADKSAIDKKNKDVYSWAFIGNPIDGFSIVNKAAGETMVLSSPVAPNENANAEQVARMVTKEGAKGNLVWTIMNPTHVNASAGAFYVQHPTEQTYAFNRQGFNNVNTLCYWAGRDTGSAMQVIERPMGVVAELESLIEEAATLLETVEANIGTVMGTYSQATADALSAAIAAAEALAEANITAANVEALQNAMDKVTVIMPVVGEYYQFHSGLAAFETTKAVYADGANVKWKDLNSDDLSFYWVAVATADGVAFQNVQNGKYLLGAANQAQWTMAAESTGANVKLKLLAKADAEKDCEYGLIVGDYEMHAGGHVSGTGKEGNIVSYNENKANTPSSWKIVKLTSEEKQALVDVAVNSATAYKAAKLEWISTVEGIEADYYAYSDEVIAKAKADINALSVPSTIAAAQANVKVIDAALQTMEASKSGAPAVGDYIRLKNRKNGKYLKANDENLSGSDNPDVTTLWEVVAGETDEVVKLKNVGTGKYMGTIEVYKSVPMVEADAAREYQFSNYVDVYAVFKDVATTYYPGYAYASLGDGHLEAWMPSDGDNGLKTHWIITKADATSFREALQATMVLAKNLLGMVGSAVGQYALSDAAAFTAAQSQAQSLLDSNSGDVAALIDASATLNGVITAATINQPVAGAFYKMTNVQAVNSVMYVDENNGLKHKSGEFSDGSEVFQFVPTTGGYYLYNVARGTYLSTAKGQGGGQNFSEATSVEDAKVVKVASFNDGTAPQVSLIPAGGTTLHADMNYSTVVGWDGASGSKSAWIIEEATAPTYTLSVTDAGWASLVLGFNATIPSGVKAYIVSGVAEDKATLEQVSGVLPANTPVLIEAAKGDYEFAHTTTSATVAGNKLQGKPYNTYLQTVEGTTNYVLSNNNGVVALYKKTVYDADRSDDDDVKDAEGEVTEAKNDHIRFAANKAYLPVAGSAKAISLDRGEGTTSIEGVQLANDNVVIYDLTGRRVEKMEKGIYIVNGKKVVIK